MNVRLTCQTTNAITTAETGTSATFGVISLCGRTSGEESVDVRDYAGLARRHPLLAFVLSLFLLSLIGIPLTGGFFGKFYIFRAALNSNLIWLTVLAGIARRQEVGIGSVAIRYVLDLPQVAAAIVGATSVRHLQATLQAMTLRLDRDEVHAIEQVLARATGPAGDVYARYRIRIAEMRESVKICRQALERITPVGPFAIDDPRITPPPKDRVYTEMEALIQHFLIYSQGFTVPAGEAYVPVEGPRGEHGFYIVSDGTNRPWRVKSRAPSLLACQALERMIVGGLIADVIAVIGSIDVVMGDVDR